MPPSWVADEDKWSRAKEIVSDERGKPEGEFSDTDWGLVTHIYQNAGGRVKKRKRKTTESQSVASPPSKRYVQFVQDLNEAFDLTEQAWVVVPKDSICELAKYNRTVSAFISPLLMVDEAGKHYLVEEFRAKMLSLPIKLYEDRFSPIRTQNDVLHSANRLLVEFWKEEKDESYLKANFLLAKGVYKGNLLEFFQYVKSLKDRNGVFLDIYNLVGKNMKLREDGGFYV